MIAELIVEN